MFLLHIVAALHDVVEGIGVKPDTLAVEHLNLQFAFLEEPLVDIGNLIATSFGRHNLFGNIHHLVGEDIEASDGIIVVRIHIALNAQRFAVFIHHHTTVLVIIRLVFNKDGSITTLADCTYGLLDLLAEIRSVNDGIACYQAHTILANEISGNVDCVCYSIGFVLDCVCDLAPELLAIAYRFTEERLLLLYGDDKQFRNTCFDKNVYRIIDHRLVINRYQLLGDSKGEGMKT